MSIFAFAVFCLAALGALASWIAGAVFYQRMLRAAHAQPSALNRLAVIAWPFAAKRVEGAAPDIAAKINKSIVALITCVMVAATAASIAANLHRLGK